jgi:hypothetical protein
MTRAHGRILSLLILGALSTAARAELRTYDFIGFFGSRTFLPITAPPDGNWPYPGEEFTGSITIDTDLRDASVVDGDTATFANAIKSMEIEIESPDQRFTFIRDVNGNGSLTLHPGTHPGQPDNSGVQEISAAVQGDLAENALGTISINLIGRAANRPIFNDPDLGSWDLTDIPAQLWDLQMQVPKGPQVAQPLLTIGHLTALTRRPDGEGGHDTYSGSDFPNPIAGQPSGTQWTEFSGAWAAQDPTSSGAYLTDTSYAAFALAAYISPLAPIPADTPWLTNFSLVSGVRTDFTFSGELSSTWRGAANTLGAAYNVVDGQDFYELRLFPGGYATVYSVIAGKRTAIATAPLPRSARVPACPTKTPGCLTGIDAHFVISRKNYDTTILINGIEVFHQLRQTELGSGQVGPTSSFNSIQFRHFKLVADVPKLFPPPRAPEYFETWSWFQFPYQASIFEPLSGVWGIGGVDSSYGSGAQPLALSLYNPQGSVPGPDYFLNTNLVTYMPVAVNSATAGIAYELVDAQNYYDVALGDNGTATLYETVAGVRAAVASAPWQGGQSRSFQLGVIRFQGKTSVEVDGQRIFNEVPQAPIAPHGWGLSSNDTYSEYNFISEYYNF